MSAPAVTAAPWVHLHDVGLRLGHVQVLDGVNLTLQAGERVALIGANGSGKSSLLRVLHGLLPPTAGQVVRDTGLREAMLFQRPYLLRASAQHNVALGLWLRGMRWQQARQTALAALHRVELQSVAHRNARTLSGGQQQRLALARAWALRPDVLLLDEPTASLDPHAKREVEALMADFAQGHGQAGPQQPMTMVFASHNLGQVKRLASRVLYLERGRVLADRPVHDFFQGPLPEAAQLFLKGELS